MKELKLFGKTIVAFGAAPEEVRRAPSPRIEMTNVTANATVSDVQSAIRFAENGDTKKLFQFYRDVMLSDDHIQSCFNTRKLAVISQPLTILPEDKNNAEDVALAVALARAKSDCENWNAGLLAIMDGSLWPVSVIERIFRAADEPRPGEPRLQYTLKKFAPVNMQQLCYKWAYQAGVVADEALWEPWIKLWSVDSEGKFVYDMTLAEPLDPARHIVHRGHLLTQFRDNWGGPFRAILLWWLFRGLGRQWFASGMERYGSPFPVGYTDATDASAVKFLEEAFDLAKKIGGLVVDESSRIELKEAMVTGMAQGYEAFFNLCNEAISFHITGLRSSQKPGGLNSGENNFVSNVREDVRMCDQMLLAETCVSQIAKPFAQVNGLTGRVKFVFGGLSVGDAKSFAEMLKTMKEAGLQPAEASLPTINERTGLTWERAAAPATLPGAAPFTPFTVFAATANAPTPIDSIVAKHSAALAQAFRGALAPVKEIILTSRTPAEAEARLKTFYADWQPQRVHAVLEEALQVCAATGAVKGKS